MADPGDKLPERRLGRLSAEFEYASVEEVLAEGLHARLDRLQSKLNEVSAAISQTFFAVRPQVEELAEKSTAVAAQ